MKPTKLKTCLFETEHALYSRDLKTTHRPHLHVLHKGLGHRPCGMSIYVAGMAIHYKQDAEQVVHCALYALQETQMDAIFMSHGVSSDNSNDIFRDGMCGVMSRGLGGTQAVQLIRAVKFQRLWDFDCNHIAPEIGSFSGMLYSYFRMSSQQRISEYVFHKTSNCGRHHHIVGLK